jgi:Tfp pilus assembly protein PilN
MKAVNLLPSEQRGSAKTTAAAATPASGGSAFGAYVVLGVLAFAVAAFALYTLAGNVIKDRKAELAKVTQEAAETQAKASALQSYADFKTLAASRVATVKGLAAARFDWERTLGDLARAVPGDVHLTSLDGTVGTQVSGGSSGIRGAVQAPALELQGCTKTQSDVASLMSRLRNVRGVTRVSLAKSDKDGTVSVSAPTAGADGATPAQLCPKGTPPSFDVVVFFERAQIASAAAPNTTGAAAATSSSSTTGASATATPAAGTTSAAAAATPSASSNRGDSK